MRSKSVLIGLLIAVVLPDEASGYYAEYTVPTPGSDDRGARRIVTGEGGEFYFTEDHYESFSRIDRG